MNGYPRAESQWQVSFPGTANQKDALPIKQHIEDSEVINNLLKGP